MRVNREDREGGDDLRSRTDRGNQNDEGIGSSATRSGGGGEKNAPAKGDPRDTEPMTDTGARFGEGGGRSENPDVTGTKDELE